MKGYPLSEGFGRLTRLHETIHHKIAKEVEVVARDYIEKLHREASIEKNYDVLKVKVTDEELKDFYQRHREGFHGDEYRVSERVRVQEIKIEVVKEKGDENCESCTVKNEQEAKQEAESALNELRSGA